MSVPRQSIGDWTPLYGDYDPLPERRLNEETLRKFGYQLINHPEKGCIHVANFYSNGTLVAQKYRGPDKSFKWRGEARSAGLFGQHLFDGSNSRRLVITEGEIDAMSVYQVNGGWPVVSLNNGTGNAENNIKDNLEWLSKFPEIVLMFDQDEAGREIAVAVLSSRHLEESRLHRSLARTQMLVLFQTITRLLSMPSSKQSYTVQTRSCM